MIDNLSSTAAVVGWVLAIAVLVAIPTALAVWAIAAGRRKHAATAEAAAAALAAENERLDRIWTEAVSRHDEIRKQTELHARDIDLVLSIPAINDLAEPKTAAFVDALATAQDAAYETRPGSADAVERYVAATRRAETAWGVALLNADLLSLSKFTDSERKTIHRVRGLMTQARRGATPQERKAYYDQAMRLLGNVIMVPEPAVAELEQAVRAELTAGVVADAPSETVTDGPIVTASPMRAAASVRARLRASRAARHRAGV